MKYRILPPEHINVTLNLPASKSISNRSLIINSLAGSDIQPNNLSSCDDTAVIVEALENMPYEIDIKAAGTAMRFLAAYLSVTEGEHVLTGTERMKHRPIGVLVDALRTIGADIEYIGEDGFPPLKIRGKQLSGGNLTIPGDVSSQYISGLLMIGPMLANGLRLHITNDSVSRSYIEMTICIMKYFGAEVEWMNDSVIDVKPIPYRKREFLIENDWSAASYWYEILALMGNSTIGLSGFMDGSRQGDSAVRYMFSLLGVRTIFNKKERLKPTMVTLKANKATLPRFDFDFHNQPDLAQTLVVTSALLGIPFTFKGLQTLRIKETDRIAAMKTEMKKLGFVLDDSVEGTLIWDGTRCEPVENPVIETYEDHRMAMAFAPASIVFPGLQIDNPGVVSKSYPRFWDDLTEAGFTIEQIDD